MKLKLIILSLLAGILIFSCSKEEVIETNYPGLGENPFDATGKKPDDPINPDSSSVTGLHKFIFAPVCANGACHDGIFEPDFRTVQSSYSSLVFHPVVKNNAAGDFTYRVVPFDTAMSVLHERVTNCCFVNAGDIMPQSSQEEMPEENIRAIEQWILNGAPDMSGNIASTPPSGAPFLHDLGFLAFSGQIDAQNILTQREGGIFYNPLKVDKNDTLDMWFDIRDLNASGDTLYGNDPSLTDLQIAFSTDKNFQSGVSTFPLAVTTYGFGLPFQNGYPYYIHYIDVDGLPYNIGDIVYFRVYVKDEDHADQTIFFHDNSPWYFRSYFSLKIE